MGGNAIGPWSEQFQSTGRTGGRDFLAFRLMGGMDMCRKKIYHILHILIIIGLVLFFGSVAFYLYINWTSKPYPIENETVRAYLKHTDDKTIAVYNELINID